MYVVRCALYDVHCLILRILNGRKPTSINDTIHTRLAQMTHMTHMTHLTHLTDMTDLTDLIVSPDLTHMTRLTYLIIFGHAQNKP